MRRLLPHLLALALGVAVAVAVGCGDRSNLIPSGTASSLKAQLAQIKADVDAGNCAGLADKLRRVHDDAANLPGTVDRRLRIRINDGIQALKKSAPGDCATAAAAQTATQTTETQPPETTTTTETPTQTETQPPPETTTTPPTTTEPVPPTDTTTEPAPTTPDGTVPPADNGGTPPAGEVRVP
jgi:outer membrane biosynthesis protein TonB